MIFFSQKPKDMSNFMLRFTVIFLVFGFWFAVFAGAYVGSGRTGAQPIG